MANPDPRYRRSQRAARRSSASIFQKKRRDTQIVLWTVLVLLVLWLGSRVWVSMATRQLAGEGGAATSSTLITKTTTAQDEEETKALPTTTTSERKITTSLNFRARPEKERGNILRQLRRDAIVTILDEEDGWYMVRTADGEEGYISASEEFTEPVE